MMNSKKVDIFSTDFFAEDPFRDDNFDLYECYGMPRLPMGLYTVEEQVGHNDSFEDEKVLEELSVDGNNSSSGNKNSIDKTDCDGKYEETENKLISQHNGRDAGSNPSAGCVTDSTCKSTSYESTEFTANNAQTDSASSTSFKPPIHTNEMDECTNPSCSIQKLTIRQQEEQIWFLRRKLQEYADLCESHNIGHDLLTKNDIAMPYGYSGAGSIKTTYEEKTYTDLMGPWDIPFHVEASGRGSPFSDEYSGITFAEHPCKTKDVAQRITRSYTDDDDALPVIRPSRRGSSQGTTTSTKHIYEAPRKERKATAPSVPVHFSVSETSQEKKEFHPPPNSQEPRVRKMNVVIERKYGRQKALYSGTTDPTSGCPHGAGALQFVKSGDVYIGEIAYGEMHGKGTYCHRKTGRLFRGNYVHNSYAGNGQC